jgi:hypothetical protein
MYHFKILNQIKLHYFLKFIIYVLNSKIVKFIIIMLQREKTTITID